MTTCDVTENCPTWPFVPIGDRPETLVHPDPTWDNGLKAMHATVPDKAENLAYSLRQEGKLLMDHARDIQWLAYAPRHGRPLILAQPDPSWTTFLKIAHASNPDQAESIAWDFRRWGVLPADQARDDAWLAFAFGPGCRPSDIISVGDPQAVGLLADGWQDFMGSFSAVTTDWVNPVAFPLADYPSLRLGQVPTMDVGRILAWLKEGVPIPPVNSDVQHDGARYYGFDLLFRIGVVGSDGMPTQDALDWAKVEAKAPQVPIVADRLKARTTPAEEIKTPRQIIRASVDNKPPLGLLNGYDRQWVRGINPVCAATMPAAFKHLVHQDTAQGWVGLDESGNIIGFIPDGDIMPIHSITNYLLGKCSEAREAITAWIKTGAAPTARYAEALVKTHKYRFKSEDMQDAGIMGRDGKPTWMAMQWAAAR